MQKRTKIALVAFGISLCAFVGLVLWSTYGHALFPAPQDSDLTPSPTAEVIAVEPTPGSVIDPDVNKQEEITGLTNNQRYDHKLVDDGSTNILIIGQDPTYGNFDTIIVISVNEKEKKAKIINFLRDIYIDYNSGTIDALNEADPDFLKYEKGTHRINAAPFIGYRIKYGQDDGRFVSYRINFMCDLMEEIFQFHIDDYILVETDGFKEIVDLFDGVDIDVPYYMHYEDETQDLFIDIEEGMQHLYGDQAEGFVRFRQGYKKDGEYFGIGDEGRKENQIAFVKAFIQQHATLSNLDKLGLLSDTISANTDTSVKGWTNVLKYGNMMRKFVNGKYDIDQEIVTGEPKIIDGSEYLILKK